MRAALALLLALALALLFAPGASAQPQELQDLTAETWTLDQPILEYGTATGDSAWVVQTESYFWANVDGEWWVDCPSGLPFRLSSLLTGPANQVQSRLQCVESLRAATDTLVSVTLPQPEPRTYATECEANVDNATVHVPPTAAGLSRGDTVAAITPSGECAGMAVVRDWGAALAAAGTSPVDADRAGFVRGEAIYLEVYDISEGRVRMPDAAWQEPSTIPICENAGLCGEGTYQEGTLHQVAGLQ